MENVRIWSKETKRSEAVWLEYLLILCGCQVWKGILDGNCLDRVFTNTGSQYIDIFLFDVVDEELCSKLETGHPRGRICISGDSRWNMISFWCELSCQLKLAEPLTLLELMENICDLIVSDTNDRDGILRLASAYAAYDNLLAQNMYTIQELFCSRRVNYSGYHNRDMLLKAIEQVENWYHEYAAAYSKRRTFGESFAFTYIQNLLDEAYIKARIRGGFDTRMILQNTNYLVKCTPDSNAVLLLKLRILRNCINYQESPDMLLKRYIVRAAEEYWGKAYSEMGDMSRENPDKVFDYSPVEYFNLACEQNPELYSGLYKLGYLYERKHKHLDSAERNYNLVMEQIGNIKLKYRTPQEYEYYYKAFYGKIRCQVKRDKINNCLSDEKKEKYRIELKSLLKEAKEFKQLSFWKDFYGSGESKNKAMALMREKMQNYNSLVEVYLQEEIDN